MANEACFWAREGRGVGMLLGDGQEACQCNDIAEPYALKSAGTLGRRMKHASCASSLPLQSRSGW